MASANRLLRFEFPIIRDAKTYERLIKTNVISAGLSKKKLESLPLADYEMIYRQMWEQALGASSQTEDELLNLLLLVEELSEFSAEHLIREDIQMLGLRDPGTVPRFYYEDGLNREQLAQFLTLHRYRNDFLCAEGTEGQLPLQYLACRRLSSPIPWTRLLESLSDAEVQKFNRLQRLKTLQALLRQEPWYRMTIQTGVKADTLATLATSIEKFLSGAALQKLASQCKTPMPVRTLVLVEGETERLLLPLFAQAAGYDFYALGIEIWPAGGKNYVPTLYREVSRYLKAGIFIVLDRDAEAIAEEVKPILRPSDAIFQIEEGEFEDIYDLSWVLQIINQAYQPYPELTPASFRAFSTDSAGRVQTLKTIWQAHNLGSFDKIAFAQQYAELFSNKAKPQLSKSMARLLEAILQVRADTAVSE